jgi:chemotaxis methyl-accepting protein methylase
MSDALVDIFQFVKEQRKIDFGIYRRDTIERRFNVLLSATDAGDYAEYLALIKRTPGELDRLITTLTITTSRFFRDIPVFETLLETVIPKILETAGDDSLRIWCAGCGRGEEAYSLAITLRNIMGDAGNRVMPVIIATDIDEAAIRAAEAGHYDEDVLCDVGEKDLGLYFTAAGDYYRVVDSIRSMVTFSVHDVTTRNLPVEGVFPDYHLILCRNVLIYFNRDTHMRVLRRLSDILLPGGYLVLGEAEMLSCPEFYEVAAGTRIFSRRGIT